MNDGGDQLGLDSAAVHNLNLFSDHFLRERLPAWAEYRQPDVQGLMTKLAQLWEAERSGLAGANEAQTEERFIRPVLRALGFEFIVQSDLPVLASRGQPDYALFLDDASRQRASRGAGAGVYANAVSVADAKRFDRPLSGRQSTGTLSQIASEAELSRQAIYDLLAERPSP